MTHAGAAAVYGLETGRASRIASWSPAQRLSLLIAVSIGLHNFAGLLLGLMAGFVTDAVVTAAGV